MTLAMVMQNDLDRFAAAVEPLPATAEVTNDEELRRFMGRLRNTNPA